MSSVSLFRKLKSLAPVPPKPRRFKVVFVNRIIDLVLGEKNVLSRIPMGQALFVSIYRVSIKNRLGTSAGFKTQTWVSGFETSFSAC